MEEFLTALREEWFREIVFFCLGGVVGFLVRQLTLSKKDKLDNDQSVFANAKDMKRKKEELRSNFHNAIQDYVSKQGNGTLTKEDAIKLSKAGDAYFEELKLICDAILDKRVSKATRDNDFVPTIVEALEKSIPAYYKAMNAMSKKFDLGFGGKFQRNNYKGLIAVVNKFAPETTIPA